MKFWNGKWDLPLRHNNTAHWLKNVETQLREAKKQENITKNLKKKQQRREKNWKVPGPNGLKEYWIEAFTSCHERITIQLKFCLEMNETSD